MSQMRVRDELSVEDIPPSSPPSLKVYSTSRWQEQIKTIVAYSIFESDLNNIRSKLGDKIQVDGRSYVYAKLTPQELETISIDQKVVFDEIKYDSPIETPGYNTPLETLDVLMGAYSRFGFDPDELTYLNKTGAKYYLLQLKGPLFKKWKTQLYETGVKLLQYFPKYAYLVNLNEKRYRKLTDNPIVSNLREFKFRDKGFFVSKETLHSIANMRPDEPSAVDEKPRQFSFTLNNYDYTDSSLFYGWLLENRIIKENLHNFDYINRYHTAFKIRFKGRLDILLKAMRLGEIQSIEEEVEPQYFANKPRKSFSLQNYGLGRELDSIPLTGKGQVIGIADGAIDSSHPDFRGKLAGFDFRCGKSSNVDKDNHGTHLSGILVGNSSGIARGAKLYFQSLRRNDKDNFGGLPQDLEVLLKQAYTKNVRIHNNSWGSNEFSPSTSRSRQVDWFVYQYPQMLIVVSAGNSGFDETVPPGNFKLSSVAHPGTAKNVLTVGATEAIKSQGKFPTGLWKSSGRGPTTDSYRRIKPDVLAPGTNIAGPKSSNCTGLSRTTFSHNKKKFIRLSGTSQATAVASGCAAIIREHYAKSKHYKPSAALLKATIINGAYFLDNSNVSQEQEVFENPPNFHQGFGQISLAQSIPNKSKSSFKLDFVDTIRVSDAKFRLSKEGDSIESKRFKIRIGNRISGNPPLRICLAWTDDYHDGIQNHLGLLVTDEERKKKWIGNRGIITNNLPEESWDRYNNVQIVRISEPSDGTYYIKIFGLSIGFPPQDFALVVTGNLTSKLKQYGSD